MQSVLITGANRGLGLEFVKRFVNLGWQVFACCRQPKKAKALQEIAVGKPVHIHPLDVSKPDQIFSLARILREPTIDVLLNNAGTYGHRGQFAAVDYEEWSRVFAVNTMAPLRMAEVFAPNIARSKRKVIVSITSKMGSIADNTSGGSYIYRSSKAALNAVMRSLSFDLAAKGVICIVVHPGWVKTDMGGPNALISPATSAVGITNLIQGLKPQDSGKFFNYDGTQIPW